MSPSSNTPRRIGLNLLWLVPGVVGGSEEYTTRLLLALAELGADDLDFTIFANSSFAEAYPDLTEIYRTVIGPVSGRSKSLRVAAETSWLGWQSRRRDIELMHHMGGILPGWRPTPTILTIHDLQPLAMPSHFRLTKRLFNGFVVPRSVRAARTVVTLTEFTRRDLTTRLGVSPDRIVVVPPGFSLRGDGDDVVPDVRGTYGLEDHPFFLLPTITYPHKNHLMLLRAFARLHEDHPETMLVLTGGKAQMEGDVRSLILRLGLSKAVCRTGRIPEADIDALYRAATALTFPSLYEGFGLPVLEAMSRGCPVIAADATALPEVVDGAGVLVQPNDPEKWRKAMASVLEDVDLRDRLIVTGHERTLHYTWPAAAKVLVEVYRNEVARA